MFANVAHCSTLSSERIGKTDKQQFRSLHDRIRVMKNISEDLRSRARHYRHLGQVNYAGAVVLFLSAIATSTLATIYARQGAAWLPWVAAAPGMIVAINSSFKFELKSLWHFEKSRKLDAIQRQGEFGEIPVKVATDWWNNTDEKMDEKWPSFGPFSGFQKHAELNPKGDK